MKAMCAALALLLAFGTPLSALAQRGGGGGGGRPAGGGGGAARPPGGGGGGGGFNMGGEFQRPAQPAARPAQPAAARPAPPAPRPAPPAGGSTAYKPPTGGNPGYKPPTGGNPGYKPPAGGNPGYKPPAGGNPGYKPPTGGNPGYRPPPGGYPPRPPVPPGGYPPRRPPNTVIVNQNYQSYHGAAWGWNRGVAWYPAPSYWGGGFWGALAIGATSAFIYGSIVNANQQTITSYQVAPGSPGAQLLQNYQLTQTDCSQSDLVIIYGPQNSVICAYPSALVGPGTYTADPSGLTISSQ